MGSPQITFGALEALLNRRPLPQRQPILEVHSWRRLDPDRLSCQLVDGQNVARGVTHAKIAVQQAIERQGHVPMLLQLQNWSHQEVQGTPFILITEAFVLGPSERPSQVQHLNNLSKRAATEVPMTQALMSESEHYTPERRTMEPPQMTPNNPPNPGHSAERAIAEALTQPGPAHVDNIYSRGAFAPTVSAATSPASTFEPPRAGGMGLGQARAVTSPSPSGGFTPLRSLNAYVSGRWKIKARVLTKSDVRKFNNSRGEGQLFKVDLKDQSGEISATFFGRAVDKYYSMLKPGQVFTFQRGQVKSANKRYESGEYALTFEEHAHIEAVDEDQSIPGMSYEFRPLCDVVGLPSETLVDVKAVVFSVAAPFTFVAKTSNKEMTKREIGLWDPSGSPGYSTMELTLWNERAVGNDFSVGAVVFLKKARVTEYNQQKSLSSPAQIELHPDHEDSFTLMRKFKEFQESGQALPTNSKTFSNPSSGQCKTIEGCRQEDVKLASPGAMGGADKAVHKHQVVAVLTSLPTERPPYYNSCPQQVESIAPTSRPNAGTTRMCNKKVTQKENGDWTCAGGHVSAYPEFRYLCRMNILDHTDQLEVNFYDEVMRHLLGCEAREYVPLYEAGSGGGEQEQPLKELHRKMEWKKCSLVLRAQKEIWQENERVRYSVDSATPIPFEQDARQMLADIMASIEG